jgi:hypothetical protein
LTAAASADWKAEHDKVEKERWKVCVENIELKKENELLKIENEQLKAIESRRTRDHDIKLAAVVDSRIIIQASLVARKGGAHDCTITIDTDLSSNPMSLTCASGKRDLWVENSRRILDK